MLLDEHTALEEDNTFPSPALKGRANDKKVSEAIVWPSCTVHSVASSLYLAVKQISTSQAHTILGIV